MKNSTDMILDRLPVLNQYINTDECILISNEALSKLNDMEQTFLKLVCFFEDPNEQNFNLESIYKTLEDDWLVFALEVIFVFFKKDTYLLKESKVEFVTENNNYLNQSQFVDFLNNNGVKYTRQKMNTYIKRGKIPEPSLVVAGVKYWDHSVCVEYLKSLGDKHGIN